MSPNGGPVGAAPDAPQSASRRSMYTRLAADVLFPLQERLKSHRTMEWLRELEASQWWSRERIAALQLERLRELLGHAGRTCVFYRERFAQAGFDPAALCSVDDLQRLPLLSKADIRASPDALRSSEAAGLKRFNTGGSSGEPLVFYIGRERIACDVAAKWRATRWWDVDIGDPEIVVWGSPIELGAQDHLRGVRDRVFRTRLLPAFAMSEAKLDEFVATIRRMRPRMLFGYPSALAKIAAHARARGVALDDLGVAVAFVTAERLYDDQRTTIERAFACRVANGYGARDAGFVAHQCPAGGMHIGAEYMVVETVGADGRPAAPGQSGEIVVTNLATRDYPFIRYRTGDVGVLDDAPCACGRGLPVLRDIEGRTTDFVVAHDGTVMHGLALIYVLRDLPGIASFRIVQESRELTRVTLVPSSGFGPPVSQAIVQAFKARLGPTVAIAIELTDAILPERSGKFRYVVSKVVA